MGNRPVGVVKPANDHAAAALLALHEKRLRDAETHIAAVTGSNADPASGKGADPKNEEDNCAPSPTEGGRYNTQGKEDLCSAATEDLCSAGMDQAWKLLLSGLVALDRRDLATAEAFLLQASSLAFIEATAGQRAAGFSLRGDSIFGDSDLIPGSPPGLKLAAQRRAFERDSLRVSALALHHVGWIYRRQDRPDAAYRTHLSAHALREQHGSFEELWETAVELALDADIARRHDDARHWHRAAIEAAKHATEEPERKGAIAWTNLATSCIESGRYEEAVNAARNGRDCWREHDLGHVSAARADLKLGSALLKQGEALHDRGDPLAQPLLDEAIEWLTTAHENLSAFGPGGADDARSCLELKDFAQCLRTSLELG